MRAYDIKIKGYYFFISFFSIVILSILVLGHFDLIKLLLLIGSIFCIIIFMDANKRSLCLYDNRISLEKSFFSNKRKVYKQIFWDQVYKICTNKSGKEYFTAIIPNECTDNKLCKKIFIHSTLKNYPEIISKIIVKVPPDKVDKITMELRLMRGGQ